MKQFIVMWAMIMLGAFIYNLIAGGENSIMGALEAGFRNQIESRAGAQ